MCTFENSAKDHPEKCEINSHTVSVRNGNAMPKSIQLHDDCSNAILELICQAPKPLAQKFARLVVLAPPSARSPAPPASFGPDAVPQDAMRTSSQASDLYCVLLIYLYFCKLSEFDFLASQEISLPKHTVPRPPVLKNLLAH